METTGGGGLSPAGAISTDPRGMPVPEGGGAPVPAAVKLDPAGGVMPLAAQEPMPLVPIPPPSNMGAGDWPAADPMPGQAAVPAETEPGEDAEPTGLMPCPPSSVEPKGTPTAPTGDPTSPMGVSAVMPGPKAGPAPMDWACAEPHIEMRITRRAKGEGCDFMSTSRAPREPPCRRRSNERACDQASARASAGGTKAAMKLPVATKSIITARSFVEAWPGVPSGRASMRKPIRYPRGRKPKDRLKLRQK